MEVKFIEKMANDRVKEYINNYINNDIILNFRDKLCLSKEEIKELKDKNNRYKEYIMSSLGLKTDDEFRKVVK